MLLLLGPLWDNESVMHPLLVRHPIITDQITRRELAVIIRECEAVLKAGTPGDIVELGCYEGTTALFLQRLLKAAQGNRRLHVYDSFAGLPPKTASDASPAGEQFTAGKLYASKSSIIKHFKHAGLPLPTIHKGWFEELQPADMPAHISFAFLDGDFYTSIAASLRLVWPRLSPGAVVIVDDYHTEALPGVRRAVEEWSRQANFAVRNEASLAILSPRL